jgi:ABC-2 type transport system ATP-binding protein
VPPAIRTRGLTKRYGEMVAVDHLDLVVREGEIFGLLGPNGAGKTTTVLMLLGLSEPTSGSAEVVGLDPQRHPLEVKRKVGYLPDSVGFYDDLTGRQNLRYTARLNGIPDEESAPRIDALLAEVGLADRADDPVGTYSRGMRQRLGLADAMVKDPKVLILDEPTVGIDPEGVSEVLDLIRALPGRGVTVMLSSHLLEQVQSVCDRIGIFVRGRMVAQGTLDELGDRRAARVVFELRTAGGDPQPVVAATPGVRSVREEEGLVVVEADRDVRAEVSRRLAEAGIGVVHLALRQEQLGDIYRRWFREAGDGDRN